MITIEELKKKRSETTRLIGLDLGSKRIGVSICDEKQSIATPLKTLNKTNAENLISELKIIIDENNKKILILNKIYEIINSVYKPKCILDNMDIRVLGF